MFKSLKNKKVSPKELQKSKDHMIGTFSLSLETSDDLAGYYGMSEILREPLETPEEEMKKIAAVTADAVGNVAKELFVDEGLNLAMIGPYKNESFIDVLKI